MTMESGVASLATEKIKYAPCELINTARHGAAGKRRHHIRRIPSPLERLPFDRVDWKCYFCLYQRAIIKLDEPIYYTVYIQIYSNIIIVKKLTLSIHCYVVSPIMNNLFASE